MPLNIPIKILSITNGWWLNPNSTPIFPQTQAALVETPIRAINHSLNSLNCARQQVRHSGDRWAATAADVGTWSFFGGTGWCGQFMTGEWWLFKNETRKIQSHSADRLGYGKILVNGLMVGLMFCYLIGGVPFRSRRWCFSVWLTPQCLHQASCPLGRTHPLELLASSTPRTAEKELNKLAMLFRGYHSCVVVEPWFWARQGLTSSCIPQPTG